MRPLICLLFATLSYSQTITTLQTTTTFGASRPIINTNFTELNTYTMKNRVFNDLLMISPPSGSPASGYLRVYAKTDSGICWKTSVGAETCTGAGVGDVTGPASAVADNFTSFNGTGGKTIKDSGSNATTFAVAAKGVTNGDSHNHVGGDGAAIDETVIALADITTNNASITKHGFLKKLSNDVTQFMDGTGVWSVPAGGGDVTKVGDCAGGDCYQSVTANQGYMGPATGAPAPAGMRALVAADIPSLSATYQPLDADLTTIAALACSENQIIKRNGSSTWICAADSGTGGATESKDLTDFQATVVTKTLTIATGKARIGNYAPVLIATGGVTFTGTGSGNVKVYINSSNNLVCEAQTGVTYSAPTGALQCSTVTTPAYAANSIPIADVTVTTGTPVVTTDERAFLSTRGISAGTGILITDAGGVATIAIDTATVPQLGAASNDFTGIVSALELAVLSSTEPTCNTAARGRIIMVYGGAGVADTLRVCRKDGSNVYAWTALY